MDVTKPKLGRRWRKGDFENTPVDCARQLIGTTFLWNGIGGIVVETEAYAEHGDEACHTFVRSRAREFVTEQSAGTIYAYLNYGVHWLFNVLTKHESSNGFVLLRAVEPMIGIEQMKLRRDRTKLKDLCSGPGKLTQALNIGPECHGENIVAKTPPHSFGFFGDPNVAVVTDTRIGITKAADFKWRFLLASNTFVSKKVSKAS